jgi:hypothetical protein
MKSKGPQPWALFVSRRPPGVTHPTALGERLANFSHAREPRGSPQQPASWLVLRAPAERRRASSSVARRAALYELEQRGKFFHRAQYLRPGPP